MTDERRHDDITELVLPRPSAVGGTFTVSGDSWTTDPLPPDVAAAELDAAVARAMQTDRGDRAMKIGDTPRCCEEAKGGLVEWQVTWGDYMAGADDREAWCLPGAPNPNPVRFCPYCGERLPVTVSYTVHLPPNWVSVPGIRQNEGG